MFLLAVCALSAMGQAKKPTLMVVPSDAWCKEHGYEQTFEEQANRYPTIVRPCPQTSSLML